MNVLVIIPLSVGRMVRFIKSILPERAIGVLRNVREYPLYPGRTLRPDTFFASQLFFWIAVLLSPLEFISRVRNGRRMAVNAGWEVSNDNGFCVADMRNFAPAQRCLTFCQSVINSVDFDELAKSAKKPFLVPYDIDQVNPVNLAITEFALHPQILGTVSRYIGSMPVLLKSSIWYSNGDEVGGRSQFFHLDGEDVRTIKLLFMLDDIDELTRPFTLIPAKHSVETYKSLKRKGKIRFRNEKIPDDVFFSCAQRSSVVPLIGPAGTAAFVDPTRCYHFGSRNGTKARWLLMLHYQSAFSSDLPVVGKRIRSLELKSDVFDKDVSDAVLGYTHQHIIEVKRSRQVLKV